MPTQSQQNTVEAQPYKQHQRQAILKLRNFCVEQAQLNKVHTALRNPLITDCADVNLSFYCRCQLVHRIPDGAVRELGRTVLYEVTFPGDGR